MTSTLSPTKHAHYMNPMLYQYKKKRVVLQRSTYQINDPIVVQQKYRETNRKSVRFHDDPHQLEQVRYFYKSQSPITAKHDPPLMDSSIDDYKLTQPNWPTRNQIFYNTESKIRMEAVQLMDGDVEHMAENKFILQGRCRAANLSFHKLVSIRYTFDLWRTFSETTGEYRESIASTSNTWDRFYFSIPIQAKKQSTQTIYLALRYTVDDQEFWDNNNGMNYQVIMAPDESFLDTKQPDDTIRTLMDGKEQALAPITTATTIASITTATATTTTTTDKVLGKRYDFTASLTAARKPLSPPPSPPGTPVDTEIFNYTPPVFFGDAHHFSVAPSVTYQKSEPIAIASKPPASPPISAEGYQMSYSDFVNKYCFYNSHSNPIYSTFSTSSSAVLS